jgi:hypothetical protein
VRGRESEDCLVLSKMATTKMTATTATFATSVARTPRRRATQNHILIKNTSSSSNGTSSVVFGVPTGLKSTRRYARVGAAAAGATTATYIAGATVTTASTCRRRKTTRCRAASDDTSASVAAPRDDDDKPISTSYRFVVVGLIALALLLCNADRVIMSVAGVRGTTSSLPTPGRCQVGYVRFDTWSIPGCRKECKPCFDCSKNNNVK